MPIISTIIEMFQTGLGSLASYLAAHVLLCLLPAFFIAGALTALMPKEAVTRFLGKDTPKYISYPAAAVGGFVLAVCSCTIMPLFAGIYKKGAGLGPAITFLFVGPAVNILAISFTGVQIGMDIAMARLVLAIVFGILIGLIMAWIFREDDAAHNRETSQLFSQGAKLSGKTLLIFLLLLAVLISGTLQVRPLTSLLTQFTIPAGWAAALQSKLDVLVPSNAALGIEGVSVQGILLISLLVLIAISAIKGFKNIENGFNTFTYLSLGLISLTLVVASLKSQVDGETLSILITGRFIAVTLLIAALWFAVRRYLTQADAGAWLWETWRFVKQIIPLLLVGVFLAGIARAIIPANWIQLVAGKNTILANLAGVLFGVFMYFPTLVEVPVAQTFLSLGMHRGPLLAYLLADPELSLQSILITNSVIGKKKTLYYVTLVTIFSTLSGWIFGQFIK
ncbi:permease [Pelolinea submarina]|uniref:Permease n=1 Tax=Pelolinea submarina TaxID=913107 RepID=A0A347ZQ10_9CHLR|nr:permease [Pelolinea submarina]REG06280.1 hypothetical protein DFR64_2713 [Pelolinea submarina]BBB47391.1 hypothetical protein Pelsub_P0618 [Pelolinea submarina]